MRQKLLWVYSLHILLLAGILGSGPGQAVVPSEGHAVAPSEEHGHLPTEEHAVVPTKENKKEARLRARGSCNNPSFCKLPASCKSDQFYPLRGCCVDGSSLSQGAAMNWCASQCRDVSRTNKGDYNKPEVLSCPDCTSGWKCVCYLNPPKDC